MFNQIAQRLVPSLGRAASIAQAPVRMSPIFPTSSGGVSTMAMTMARSVSSQPSSLLGKGTSMRDAFPIIFPRGVIPNSLSPVTPSASPSAPQFFQNNLAQQQRNFASKKHKRVIAQSKGFRGRANRCFRIAIRRLEKSWQYAYRDRKVKKREFRKLWIQRVNAGVRQHGVSYSRFIEMQGRSGVTLDRKILSGLAMYEPFSFKAVVNVVQTLSAREGAAN